MNIRSNSKKRDPRYCQVFLDANALDRVDTERSLKVDEFLKFAHSLPLSQLKSCGVEAEIRHQNTPASVRETMGGIYTIQTNLNAAEIDRNTKLRQLLTGNAAATKHIADADHLFELYKYGGGYFITHDNRVHNKKVSIEKLAQGIQVVTLTEFVGICSKLNTRKLP